MPSGSSETRIASKRAGCPHQRPTAERWPKGLAKTCGNCSTLVCDPLAPPFLRPIPALQTMRRIWVQNYWMEDEHLRWRETEDLPSATLFINSPYDPQARLGKKRSTLWTGNIRSSHRDV